MNIPKSVIMKAKENQKNENEKKYEPENQEKMIYDDSHEMSF